MVSSFDLYLRSWQDNDISILREGSQSFPLPRCGGEGASKPLIIIDSDRFEPG